LNLLNSILHKLHSNTLITSEWFEKMGVSRQLASNYVKSGWFEKVDTGLFKRPKDEITWSGALYTLQVMNELPLHIGGKTALELHGFGHYIRINDNQKIVLWKEPETWLPKWFKKYDWDVTFEVRSAKLFQNSNEGLSEKTENGLLLKLSSPERALIEYLYDIPKNESFDEAHYIMEGLTSLRPALIQSLLENCRSVKVKRLLLYMAKTHKHAWYKHLNENNIDLGSGKREIIKGGRLDKKYQIVVPEINRVES
jgi:hypothetical protein